MGKRRTLRPDTAAYATALAFSIAAAGPAHTHIPSVSPKDLGRIMAGQGVERSVLATLKRTSPYDIREADGSEPAEFGL